MKKIFISLIVFVALCSANAQTSMYKGITSMMSETEFWNYIDSESHFDNTSNESVSFTLDIKNRPYIGMPFFNIKGQLYSVILMSLNTYEWMYYEPNIRENVLELYSLIEVSYGKPEFSIWYDWTEIPEGKRKDVAVFQKETVAVGICIAETDSWYTAGVIITDSKFKNIAKPRSSEGF